LFSIITIPSEIKVSNDLSLSIISFLWLNKALLKVLLEYDLLDKFKLPTKTVPIPSVIAFLSGKVPPLLTLIKSLLIGYLELSCTCFIL